MNYADLKFRNFLNKNYTEKKQKIEIKNKQFSK